MINNKYLKIFSPVFFLLSIILILLFKTIPTSKIWKDYAVLYVPVAADDSIVINTLHSCGIENEISLSGQYLPISLPENSVEISMFKLNRDNPEYDYYIKRNAYFFDKFNNFRLYYIPAEYKSQLYETVSLLNSKNIQAGIDATAAYPWLLPLITFALVLVLSFFAKKKLLFLISALIPVLYLLSNPFYSHGISCLILILVIFYISNVWKRRGFYIYLLSHYSIPSMLFVSILCGFSISLKAGLFFILTIFSILTFMVSYSFVEEYLKAKKSFNPVYIMPARKISLYAKKTNIVMPALLLGSIVLIGLFFMNSTQLLNSHFSKLLLPASSSTTDQSLPQLEDYYKWTWNIKAYPYTSLNKNSTPEYMIEYSHYSEEKGFISETKDIMVYNQNFKDNIFDEIDYLPFNSVEKLFKSEGKDFKSSYASTSSYSTNLFSVIMMIICFFVLLFIYFYTIIKKEI